MKEEIVIGMTLRALISDSGNKRILIELIGKAPGKLGVFPVWNTSFKYPREVILPWNFSKDLTGTLSKLPIFDEVQLGSLNQGTIPSGIDLSEPARIFSPRIFSPIIKDIIS